MNQDLSILLGTPRTWLVTGVAGFIGSHLLETLLSHGQLVRGVDNFATGSRQNLWAVRRTVGEAAWRRFSLIQGDIRERDVCAAAVHEAEFILHQAALGSVPRSLEDPDQTWSVNVEGTRMLFRAAAHADVTRIVYASSSSVYGGGTSTPNRVGEEGTPLSPYARSKLANEADAQRFDRNPRLRAVGLRYFNVFGPRQNAVEPYITVWPRWLRCFARHEAPVIFGSGQQCRDYCPVQNTVQANIRAALASHLRHRVYNVGLGESRSLLELFESLKRACLAHGFGVQSLTPKFAPRRQGDMQDTCADISGTCEDMGYRPSVSFDVGVRELVRWYVRQGSADAEVRLNAQDPGPWRASP